MKEFILGNRKEGTKPNEFELAKKFGVGRSTIREAVKGLVSKGILEVRRGAGTYVISTSSLDEDPLGLSRLQDKYKLALELFDVRLMLEPEVVGLLNAFIMLVEYLLLWRKLKNIYIWM